MLKKYVTIITIFIVGIATGISISFCMLNQKKEAEVISVSNEQSGLDFPESSKSNLIARIDYPLIDVYFQSSSNYRVEIVDFMNNEIRKEIKEKGDYFQYIKGDFSVKIIPSGMGTTAEFYLFVYENDKCIKEMECVSIESDVFEGKWIGE